MGNPEVGTNRIYLNLSIDMTMQRKIKEEIHFRKGLIYFLYVNKRAQAILGLIGIAIIVLTTLFATGSLYKGVRLYFTGTKQQFTFDHISTEFKPWGNKIYFIAHNDSFGVFGMSGSYLVKNLREGDKIDVIYSKSVQEAIYLGQRRFTLFNVLVAYRFTTFILIMCLILITYSFFWILFSHMAFTKRIFREEIKQKKEKYGNTLRIAALSSLSVQVITCYIAILLFCLLLLKATFSVESSGVLLAGGVIILIVITLYFGPLLLILLLKAYHRGKNPILKVIKEFVPVVGGIYFIFAIIEFMITRDFTAVDKITTLLGEFFKYLFHV
jgi:hypothetical protein